MKHLEDKLVSIELKARQLITENKELKQKLETLENENYQLKMQLEQKEDELRNKEEINQYKHIASSLSSDEKKQTRQKINALVREIDHCIALLND